MLLLEFDQDKAFVSKIVALANQLQQEKKDGKIGKHFTVDQLLDYFQDYDVILDTDDLYNMIKVPPLKDVIKNIQGKRVVFKGDKEKKVEMPDKAEDNKKVVKKMAKKAMKK